MSTVFGASDVEPEALSGHSVAMLGYGSQGRAQALNLRDSGIPVTVAVRPGGLSAQQAVEDGFAPLSIPEATRGADVLVFALPDVEMGRIFEESIRGSLRPNATLVFAHGFAIQYGLIRPPTGIDVVLVAPMGAGPIVRSRYLAGSGVPALIGVHRDYSQAAKRRALAYAHAIGCSRVAMIETTFKEETESDLFGEQAVLCGGLPELIRAAFETLTAGGISPEIAYVACLHEVKLIVDLIFERGLDGMVENISQTAEWGAYEAGPRIIGSEARKGLEETLRRIQSGAFAREWIEEAASGHGRRLEHRARFQSHPLNAVGRRIRPLFNPRPV